MRGFKPNSQDASRDAGDAGGVDRSRLGLGRHHRDHGRARAETRAAEDLQKGDKCAYIEPLRSSIMSDWSPAIANEFISMAAGKGRALTQMQLQKLVYIAHGWNLAIGGHPLTLDDPEAWEYGPVYRELRGALRSYGRDPVTRKIKNAEFIPGAFDDDPDADAVASLDDTERQVIDRVFVDYGGFHAFQLSALTHKPGTPWTTVYSDGAGKFAKISADKIKNHFLEIASARRSKTHN